MARIGTERLRHESGTVLALAFQPDGKHLVSVGTDGTVREWDVATGKGRVTERMTDSVVAAAFSRDGSRIAVGMDKGRVKVIPAEGVLERWREITALEFTSDGAGLAIGHRAGRLVVCEIASGRERWEAIRDSLKTPHVDLAVSPDGRWLASEGDGGLLRLFDVSTGALIESVNKGTSRHVAWAPDGTYFVTTGTHAGPWELGPLKRVTTLLSTVGAVAFSPDGSKVAAFSDNGSMVMRSTENLDQVREIPRPSGRFGAGTLAFSADGTLVATSTGRTIEIYDAATGKAVHDAPGFDDDVERVAFVDGGRKLLTLSRGQSSRGLAQVWDIATGERLKGTVPYGDFARVTADGRRLYTHGRRPIGPEMDGLTGWDAATLEPLHTVPLVSREFGLGALEISPDGAFVTIARLGEEGIPIHEIPSGRLIRTFPFGVNDSQPLVFMPDRRTLFTGSWELPDGSAAYSFWDIHSGELLGTLAQGTGQIQMAVPSYDGRFLALLGDRPTVEVWDVAGRWRLCEIDVPGKVGGSIAFTPDGRRLIMSTGKQEMRVWDLVKGEFELTRPGGDVMAVGPDGRVAAVADPTVIVWKLPDAEPFPRVEPAQMEGFWAEACGYHATKSFRAGWQLTGGGDAAVEFLARALAPAEEDMTDIVRRLDSDDSGARDEATASLAAKGWAAERDLRKVLAAPPSVEAKLRIELLLARLGRPAIGVTGTALRRARGAAILERIGTPKAREALKGLGFGK